MKPISLLILVALGSVAHAQEFARNSPPANLSENQSGFQVTINPATEPESLFARDSTNCHPSRYSMMLSRYRNNPAKLRLIQKNMAAESVRAAEHEKAIQRKKIKAAVDRAWNESKSWRTPL